MSSQVANPAAPPHVPPWRRALRVASRLHPALADSLPADLRMIGRVSPPAAKWAWAAPIALAAVFTLLRLTITDVYTESLLFMGVALLIGLTAPGLGALLVLAHVVFEIVRVLFVPASPFAFGPSDPSGLLITIAGRLVGAYLLWLLVVEIPLVARAIPWAVMNGTRPAELATRRLIGIGAALVGGAFMVFVWTQGVPLLIRPVFTWGGYGAPTYEAIAPVQEQGMVLVAIAAIAAAALAGVRLQVAQAPQSTDAKFEEPEDYDLDEVEEEPNAGLAFIGAVAAHVMMVVVLGGLISGILDLVILAGSVIVAGPLVRRFVAASPLARVIAFVPWLIRFALGFASTYIVGLIVNSIFYQPLGESEFFPFVLTVAIGIILFNILLAPEPPKDEDDEEEGEVAAPVNTPPPGDANVPRAGVVASVVAALMVIGLGHLAFPAPVSADNCSGLTDCAFTVEAGAGLATGATGVTILIIYIYRQYDWIHTQSPEERERRRRKGRRRRRPQREDETPGKTEDEMRRERERLTEDYEQTPRHMTPPVEPPPGPQPPLKEFVWTPRLSPMEQRQKELKEAREGKEPEKEPEGPDKEPLRKASEGIDAVSSIAGEGIPDWDAVPVPTGFSAVTGLTTGVGLLDLPLAMVNRGIGMAFDATRKISKALGGDPPRGDFTIIETPQRVALPEIRVTDASEARSAAARAVLHATLDVHAAGRAAIVSFDRYGGAREAGDDTWAAQQMAAVVRNKKAMGAALLEAAPAIEAYRDIRIAEGEPDQPPSPASIRAYQERLRTDGMPPGDVQFAKLLGVSDEELEEIRQDRLNADPGAQSPTPSAYLTRAATTFRELGGVLASLPDAA